MHKVMSQTGINRLRVLFGLPLFFIDPDELLSFPRVFSKTIIGDAIQPGGKFCFATEGSNVLIRADKGVLCKIIGQRGIAPSELAQQAANARLMTTDQLAISVLVVINEDSGNKAGIG